MTPQPDPLNAKMKEKEGVVRVKDPLRLVTRWQEEARALSGQLMTTKVIIEEQLEEIAELKRSNAELVDQMAELTLAREEGQSAQEAAGGADQSETGSSGGSRGAQGKSRSNGSSEGGADRAAAGQRGQ